MVREIGRKTGVGWAVGLFTVALAFAGCGNSSSEDPALSVINLGSPSLQANGELKPTVHCGWGSIWVPLEWGRVPEDTKELAIYLGRFKRAKEGGERKVVVQFAYLSSKLKPTEHRLAANVLPEGVSWSYFGRNCVLPQKGQRLLLAVFALSHRAFERPITRSMATRLTEEALANPHLAERTQPPGKPLEDAIAMGQLITSYTATPH